MEQNDVPGITAALEASRSLEEFAEKGVDLVSVADDKNLSPLIVASALGHLEMALISLFTLLSLSYLFLFSFTAVLRAS